MKTSMKFTLFLIFISMVSCSKSVEKEEVKSEPLVKPATEAAPENLIAISEAKEKIENFNKAHPDELGEEYAMRTWISLEELKAYIQFIESESAKKNIPVSGIDFIYSQQDKAEPGSKNPGNKNYKLTLMMAPTYSDGNGNIAFDPIYSTNKNPKKLKDLLDKIPEADSLEREKGAPPSSIANRLNTCPSVCN